MLREAIVGLLILIGLVNYVMFFPPTIGRMATPGITPGHIRQEWYFFPTYRWLKLTSLSVGITGSIVYVTGLFLWPFLDAGLEKIAPRRNLWLVVGTACFLMTIVFMLWEAMVASCKPSASHDHRHTKISGRHHGVDPRWVSHRHRLYG